MPERDDVIADLRTRLATAEAQVAAAQSERDMTRAMAAERAALRAGLAAAEEQLADANRGYSLLCDEEARLNDDLAAARRALEEARAAIRWLRAEPRGVPGEGLVSAEDDWTERDEWQRGYDAVRPALEAALLAPERPREETK